MSEQRSALLELTKKQRADRQFLLSRLESAFSRVDRLETEQSQLTDRIKALELQVKEEEASKTCLKDSHTQEVARLKTEFRELENTVSRLEKVISAHPYFAFSNSAQSQSAQDDPFNVDYLAQSTDLTSAASFGFALPKAQDKASQYQATPTVNSGATTTWDLLTLGDDLPEMADTIRQSVLQNRSGRLEDAIEEARQNSGATSQVVPSEHRGTSLSSSETRFRQDVQPNSRTMSTSSLTAFDTFGSFATPNSDSHEPQAGQISSMNPLPIVDYPVILAPEPVVDLRLPEGVGYPSVFEASVPAERAASPQPPAASLTRYTTHFTAQLDRRVASLRSQKLRFEQMCELEARNVEQEIVRSSVFEALSKAGEMLKTCEHYMSEADLADRELGALNHDSPQEAEQRTDAYRGAEFRATKARNTLESAYSRLCSALDFATQKQNVMTHDQKAQRSSSLAMQSLKSLLGRSKEPEPAEQHEAQPRETLQRTSLGSNSVSNIAIRPSHDPAFSRPLGSAVQRLKQESNASPQRVPRPETSRTAHRRTVSDTPLFPPTPDVSPEAAQPDHIKNERVQRPGRMSDAEMITLINELEERRLALYRP